MVAVVTGSWVLWSRGCDDDPGVIAGSWQWRSWGHGSCGPRPAALRLTHRTRLARPCLHWGMLQSAPSP
eukprot:56539-Alexandrium_andersonii.AAC.1